MVGEKDDHRLLQHTLAPQLLDHESDVVIQPVDFVVVGREVLPRFGGVDEFGRHPHVRRRVAAGEVIGVPDAVGVMRGEPEEEGPVSRARTEALQPLFLATVAALARNRLAVTANLKGGLGRSDEALDPVVGIGSEMCLAGMRGVVTGLAQKSREERHAGGQGPVQLRRGFEVVRVARGQDAAATRTAAGGGDVGPGKPQALPCQAVDLRRAHARIPVAAEIGRADVVAEDQDKIRTHGVGGGEEGAEGHQGRQNERWGSHG